MGRRPRSAFFLPIPPIPPALPILPILPVLLLLPILLFSGCSRQESTGVGNQGTAARPVGAAGAARAEENRTGEQPGNRMQIVATIFPQYDFARQIVGDYADVSMLLKPGEEIHSYEPTPQDIKMIQNCDLFIYTGGENDVWVENILSSLGDEGPRSVRLLDLVETSAEVHLEGMMAEKGDHDHADESDDHAEDHDHDDHDGESDDHAEDHDHDDHDGESVDHAEDHDYDDHDGEADDHAEDHGHNHFEEEPDEHVWTSPENCVILIEKLTDIICGTDPSHEEAYRRNGDAYRSAFEQLDREYRQMADSAARRTILFGDRFPFLYLARELDLTCYAAFSGCSAESEPSAATIAFLIDKAVEEKLPVVFKIEFSNGNIASAVSEAAQKKLRKEEKTSGRTPDQGDTASVATAEKDPQDPQGSLQNSLQNSPQPSGQTRVRVLQLHSCHNVTRDEMASGETCLSLMKKNLEALREALN